ncbi:hypothetical protein NLJ89_g2820 [Agrocybe chaxingu]|uniref:Uncharacterized protein n=1 Tax=Agrocybe chaxingu TaxID=84603 RepID=A0A9W8K633_9AGAR|nr:hypothetical protein NLJ89_g2820 [Agrocybe chaxingu]
MTFKFDHISDLNVVQPNSHPDFGSTASRTAAVSTKGWGRREAVRTACATRCQMLIIRNMEPGYASSVLMELLTVCIDDFALASLQPKEFSMSAASISTYPGPRTNIGSHLLKLRTLSVTSLSAPLLRTSIINLGGS